MAKTIKYAIYSKGRWLQNTEPNEHYCPSSKAPTMGARHDASEFRTVWGNETVFFEKLTALNYARVILEEQRWEDAPIESFEIIPE